MSERSYVDLFRARATETPAAPALRSRGADRDVELTWSDWDATARDIAARLIDLGIIPGDRVAILSETRAEWCLVDMGIMMAGAAVVPIYPSRTPAHVDHILADSGARLLFVDVPARTQGCDALGRVERVVTFETDGSAGDGSLEQLVAEGRRLRTNGVGAQLEGRIDALQPSDLATIVYTSGTTGRPKGARLTHANLVFEATAVGELEIGPDDVQLLFLPLAHAYGRVMLGAFVRWGGLTVFPRRTASDEPAALLADLQAVRPTVVGSVPALYEQAYAQLHARAEGAGGLQKLMFDWACEVAAERCQAYERGRRPHFALRVRSVLSQSTVGRRVRELFGGRIRFMVSGQSPLAPEIIRFFIGFGIEIVEGYGLTETAGATHVNRPGRIRVGSVGQPFSGVEVRVAADGELLVHGPNVMEGYHGLPKETARVIDTDGWFHTGDIGEVSEDGTLCINTRKRDLIVTREGKQVAPEHIEVALQTSPYIRRAVVHGRDRDYLTALITLDLENVASWAKLRGISETERSALASNPQVYALIEDAVSEQNTRLSTYETVRKFAILDRAFSQADGELTPTMQLRREHVTNKYRDLLDSFYTDAY